MSSIEFCLEVWIILMTIYGSGKKKRIFYSWFLLSLKIFGGGIMLHNEIVKNIVMAEKDILHCFYPKHLTGCFRYMLECFNDPTGCFLHSLTFQIPCSMFVWIAFL